MTVQEYAKNIKICHCVVYLDHIAFFFFLDLKEIDYARNKGLSQIFSFAVSFVFLMILNLISTCHAIFTCFRFSGPEPRPPF